MTKKILSVIGIIVTIVLMTLTFVRYKNNNALVIYAKDGSYAYNYAKNNLISVFNVSDSHYDEFNLIWEDFKYDVESDGLTITKYEGISEELIIPTSYKKNKIVKIEKDALPEKVKRIYLPSSVKTIEKEDFNDIEILCYKGDFCSNLKEDTDLKVKELDDVDKYVLTENELLFTYNIINDNEVEITNYIGNDDKIIIPKTINGYKVTKLSFDGTGISYMFIPESVKSISGNITSKLLNESFVTSMVILLVVLILFLISLVLFKIKEPMDATYFIGTSIVYFVSTNIALNDIKFNPYTLLNHTVYFAIISVFYLLINFIVVLLIKNNNKFDKEIKNKGNFIKEVLYILSNFDYEELDEIKEMIKYSDPVSIELTHTIERNIKEEIKSINKKNIEEKVQQLKKLIKRRNEIIKDNK